MMSKPLLEFQLSGSFNLIDSLVADTSDEEWTRKLNRRANMVGFTVWHCLRTIDWTINCAAARRDELVTSIEWQDVRPEGAFFGAGVTMQTADGIACMVSRARVRDYLFALRTESLAWLRETSEEDLDRLVDMNASSEHADHLQPAVWSEVKDLDRIPVWQLLARPAISHIRLHCGEVEAQLQAMRDQSSELGLSDQAGLAVTYEAKSAFDIDPQGDREIDLLCSGFQREAANAVKLFDAGAMGCADGLAQAFRQQIAEVPVGALLEVVVRDPAAKEDLPSLARMLGQQIRSIDSTADGRQIITVERKK